MPTRSTRHGWGGSSACHQSPSHRLPIGYDLSHGLGGRRGASWRGTRPVGQDSAVGDVFEVGLGGAGGRGSGAVSREVFGTHWTWACLEGGGPHTRLLLLLLLHRGSLTVLTLTAVVRTSLHWSLQGGRSVGKLGVR